MDYTLTLKARKISGAEGFLIMFAVRDDRAKSWWNLGGWGNKSHAIEMGGEMMDSKPGTIETGKWYDIKIELKGTSIRCYLDGQLIHDVTTPKIQSLYAVAGKGAGGEIILKVVNGSNEAQETQIELKGAGNIAKSAKLIVLTSADGNDENSFEEPTKVAPVTSTIDYAGASFKHVFPGNSVTVLRMKAQ